MDIRSLFGKIFGNSQKVVYGSDLKLLNDFNARFTTFNGNLYGTSQIKICIDTIARNGAKLTPKHIRSNDRQFVQLEKNISRLVAEKPNELDNAYSFYYKVISQLYLNNNAFICIRRSADGSPEALYPLVANQYKLLEYQEKIYLQFYFRNGQTYTVPYETDVIHLKRFYCENDILGGDSKAIIKTMSLKHIVEEGIINAIKTTQSIKGYLKTTKAMLKEEDIKATRDAFVKDFITNNKTGIAGLDATTEFTPVNLNPQTATDGQIKQINDEIKSYFGLCDEIIMSKYNEDQWNAFYESVIEPIAIQLGLEFTNKLFTISERFHGNQIVFESNRLQYASTNTKISLLKEAGALGMLTINECREILNLAPVEDGDVRVQSLNYIDKNDDERGNNNE